jgi:arylsulfatase A-like enzyme
VLYDLAALASVADREAPWHVLLFGSASSFRSFESGFVDVVRGPGGATHVWARTEPRLRLELGRPAPRVAILDLERFTGLPDQRMVAYLNDRKVAEAALPAGRHRQRIDLPEDAQAAGRNVLRFEFQRGLKPESGPRFRFAAGFHALTVLGPEDPALPALLDPASPPPFAAGEADRVPVLTQVSGTAVRYAFAVPPGSSLRFVPRLHATAGVSKAALSVSLRPVGARERELWKGDVQGRDAAEVVVPLPPSPDEPVQLTRRVEGPASSPVWAEWGAARVVGAGSLQPPEPGPIPRDEAAEARAEALRKATAGGGVVLVILDAATAGHFGCYGYARKTTPEIDRIASEGVLFEEAYAPAPYTLAAMASLWTSRYPDQHGVVEPRSGAGVRRARVTLLDLLSAAGIPSGGFVANGMAGPAFGFDRGFSRFQEVYLTHGLDAAAFRKVLPPWLDEIQGKRAFTYLHFREPHWPYDPPPPFDTLFGPEGPIPKWLRLDRHFLPNVDNRRTPILAEHRDHVVRLYDGNLAYADREVGELRKALETRGLWDRTILIIAADHGEALFEHEHVGHEVQLYEASLKIPLIVRFPAGRGPSGVRVRGFVDLLDLAPTLADLFGVRGRGGSDAAFEGRSLLPMLYGAPGKPVLLARSRAPRPRYSFRHERLKYVYESGTGHEELYDVPADPGETRDLSGHDPVRTAWYRQALQRWLLRLEPEEGDEVPAAALTPQQQENLRALGYVQ